MYVCMRAFVTRRSYSPKQSRVRARRSNRKDVSLACYRKVSMSKLDGREFHGFGAQAAKLRGPKLVVRQAIALADRHERQSVGGDDVY